MLKLNTQFQLPNGSILKNRIAKSAMSENLGDKNHGPTPTLIKAYERWAKGGTGLIITGNVMVDSNALGEPRNVVVEDEKHMEKLKQWAATVNGTDAHIWPQINHPGRQALGNINKKVVGPSAVPVKVKGTGSLFKTPEPLSEEAILEIIERFGNTAKIMQKAGFTGVQIHGAHGYLVSQFLSPISNIRTDKWGGSLENRSRFALEIYRNIRKKVGNDFPIGIKINSADFQRGGFTEEESMEVVEILSAEGIDLIEISGGTYEKAAMMGAVKKQSTIEREAYFLEYIEKARKITTTPLMLTGGFRTTSVMENAITSNQLDIVGIARPLAINPNIPNEMFSGELQKIEAPFPKTGIKSIDNMGFLELGWYELQIKRLGEGKTPNPNMSAFNAVGHQVNVNIKKFFGI